MKERSRQRECVICGEKYNIHCHEVFYGSANRKISIKYGFQEDLCGRHHNLSDDGVHFNKALDLELKQKHQRLFEETHSRDEFIQLIGRSYL